MIEKDDTNSHSPGTSKIKTTECSSLSAGSNTGLSKLEKTRSPTPVTSYEYNGTTYYQHEGVDVPTSFRLKPRHYDSNSRLRTNDDAGLKLTSEEAVAYRSHRTPFNMRGLGGCAPWPRKSLLSSFGEADLTQNFRTGSNSFDVNENRDSRARRSDVKKDSTFASSWNSANSQDNNTLLYTKSGQPYVPISIANWYRRRTFSGDNDLVHSEPESKDTVVPFLASREESETKRQSNELANGESNDMMESILNQDSNEFRSVDAIEDLSVKQLKCLKLTATPAKALVRIFEPMLENWKEVISAVSDTSNENNVDEDIKEKAEKSQTTFEVEPENKENGVSMPIVHGNEKQHIILEEMSQKLLGNSEPIFPRIPFPQKQQDDSPVTLTKNPEIEEQLECKETKFKEDVAYANSYSPATGLSMIEASSTVRNYTFTIGDRGEICRFLTPMVKELVIINNIGGKGRKSILDIGVVVESQQQFFCAIKAANIFFKSKGFQFKHLANGKDVLSFLSRDKVIPKVDCNGMYQIIVKFNLPKGKEKKVDASLGKELEKEVEGLGVEKISFGSGERILLFGHVRNMLSVSRKVKKVFDIIPSKHTWNNELGRVRYRSSKLRQKKRKAKLKERSKKVELETSSCLSNLKSDKAQRLDLNLPMIQQEKEESAPLLSNQSVTLTLLDSVSTCDPSEMELPKFESSEDTIISHDPNKSAMRSPPPGDRKDDRSEAKTSPLISFIKLMEGGDSISNLKLLQDRFVICPNDNEENEGQAFEIVERAMAAVGDVNGEMQKKAIPSGNDEKLENTMVVRNDANGEELEKTKAGGDYNQKVKPKAYIQSQVFKEIKENAQSKKEVCKFGKGNELIFQSIDENNIDIVKDDTNWYGNISDFVTVKNECCLWNVYVTFESKEETETAYFGLREKYNGEDSGS